MQEMTLREIQLDALEILRFFSAFCEKNNLTYKLTGGTLLGAVRHKGFIPWDDDVDVSMPRSEYERFIHMNLDEFKSRGLLVDVGPYCKISDTNTKLVSQYRHDDKYVTLDVLPIDGLPEDIEQVKEIYRKTDFYREVFRLNYAKYGEGKTLLKKLVKPFFIVAAKILGVKWCVDKLEKTVQQNEYEKSKYVGVVIWGLYGPGERMLKTEYEKTVYMDFEGEKYPTCSCWDSYLQGIYGDYMTFPPVEKRKTHHAKVYRLESRS